MFYEVSKSVIVRIVAPDTLFGERKNRTEGQIYVRRKTHLMTSISLFLQEGVYSDCRLSYCGIIRTEAESGAGRRRTWPGEEAVGG